VVVWSVGQAILKAAPHPNAAKLFYDFVLSKDGQAIIERIGYGAVRPDVPADPAYAYYYSTIMKGVPIIAFDEVQAGIDRPKLIAEWAAIVGLS
jgi:iron(III) transport system substrate-binding protein